MNFYQLAIRIVRHIFFLFNGPTQVQGLENLPKEEPYIIAATHRSLYDPFYLAIVWAPEEISFMAKNSLFKWKWLGYLLTKAHVFPVNREKPSPKTLKFAVKQLEQGFHLGIFPSGTRHSTEIKSGTAFIQRLSKKAIVPVAIQPPLTKWQFLKRQPAKIAIGSAINYDPQATYDKAKLEQIDQSIANAFDELDQKIDPQFHYDPK